MNKAVQAYYDTKVNTMDQGQLLILLYDGALNYLQQARDKMLAKDFAAKGILISKVIDIVSELSASLNMEKGGSLAENLNNLYILCTARLLQANLKMNVDQLDSVSHILSGLRGAYAQILETPEARKAAAEIASRMQPSGSSTKRAQPIAQPQITSVPRGRAQALYGKSALNAGNAFAAPAAPAGVQTAPAGMQAATPPPVAASPTQARAHVQNFTPSPLGAPLPGAYAKYSS